MTDHTVIILVVAFFGAWGLLVAVTFGQVQTRIEALERKVRWLEQKLTVLRVG